jgi:thiol-disulfide isomerase/thioredoxin
MRIFQLFVVAGLCLATRAEAQTISGKRIGADGKSSGFFVEAFDVKGSILFKSVKFDEQGGFKIEIPGEKAQLYWINNIPFYLYPNETVDITLPEQKKGAAVSADGLSAAEGLAVVGKRNKENLIVAKLYANWFNFTKNLGQDSSSKFIRLLDQLDKDNRAYVLKTTKDKALQETALFLNDAKSIETRLRFLSMAKTIKPDDKFYTILDQTNLNGIGWDGLKNIGIRSAAANYYKLLQIRNGANRNDYAIADNASTKRMTWLLNNVTNQRVLSAEVAQAIIYHLSVLGLDEELQQVVALARTKITDPQVVESINVEEKKYLASAARAVAPDFELPDAQGKMHLLSEYRGKIVAIDVWATWCVPCLQSLPKFLALREQYKNNKNIEFISISIDDAKVREKWLTFLKDKHMTGVDLHAPTGDTNSFMKDYAITGIPRYILIDKKGKIIVSHAPSASTKEYAPIITEALKLE